MSDSSEIKVSVILTVYNSASFLRSCLDSILSQTLKEIEIICIDDESEDGSDVILEDYSRRDERVEDLQQMLKLFCGNCVTFSIAAVDLLNGVDRVVLTDLRDQHVAKSIETINHKVLK